jgi:NADPH:quinone reductase-like Zn-dependent oxidoreductase
MQAMVLNRYGTTRDLRLAELPMPVPGPRDVLVKVYVAAVNDWDWGLLRGKPWFMRLLFCLRRPRTSVLGMELAGHVVAVGAEVTAWRPGNRVAGDLSADRFGAFAEYVLAREDSLTRVPEEMSDDLAAAIPHAGLLAWQGLIDVARLRPGERVLINGAGGGVGALGAQIARSIGAEVTGVDAASKLDTMRSVRFHRVLDYHTCDFSRTGERYDVILDTKAMRSPFALCRALRKGGRYVGVGGQMPRVLQILVLGPLVGRLHGVRLHILGLRPNRGMDRLLELWRAHGLRCPVEGPYSLAELPRALELFGQARHIGKVLIRVGAPAEILVNLQR